MAAVYFNSVHFKIYYCLNQKGYTGVRFVLKLALMYSTFALQSLEVNSSYKLV